MENNITTYKPKAFISCSLRDEDRQFVEMVEDVLRNNGYEPMGTIGRHNNYAEPIAQSMVKELKKADVFVMVATPRYFQEEINQRIKRKTISEMLHVESGMAYMDNKPMVVFVQQDTHVGSFIPGITQYIQIPACESIDLINAKITILLDEIKSHLLAEIEKADERAIKEWFRKLFMWIGIFYVSWLFIKCFFNSKESEK